MKKYPYSVGSAVIYSIALLSTLWWIPILGPIIIGYITGRKAGGPIKGLIAMAVPIVLYFMAVHAINEGLINIPPVVKTYLGGTLLTSTAALPFIQYIQVSTRVAMNVGTYIEHYIYYAPPSFFIMLSFAFIGGAVSRQIILERGLYKEVVRPKKKIKPFRVEKERDVERAEDQEPETDVPRRRAPREYIPNPEPINRNPSPQPMYAYAPQPMYPQAQPQMQNFPQYQQYGYPQYPQYAQYPQYPHAQQDQYPYEYPPNQPVSKRRKAAKRRSKKKIRPFQDERESKFVVHEMDTPKNVERLIKKKSVNREHSIAFL